MATAGKPVAELSILHDLASQLQKEDVCSSADAVVDILNQLEEMNLTRALLKKSHLKTVLKRASKRFETKELVDRSDKLRKAWAEISMKAKEAKALRRSTRARSRVNYKEMSAREQAKVDEAEPSMNEVPGDGEGGALSVSVYRKRLVLGRKKIYKDPPVLPPMEVHVLKERMPLPKRDSRTGEFHFPDYPEFLPNLSPMEVLQRGSFGGTYFRPIVSAVLNRKICSKEVLQDIPKEWLKGLDLKTQVCASNYDKDVNMYKVKCGGSLGMWESSGWISPIDPYGWFQWYCRFFQGRRSTDDQRQVGRGLRVMGRTGRFRVQLMNKVIRNNSTYDDHNISPVTRQNLQHWGFVLTRKCFKEYKRKKKL